MTNKNKNKIYGIIGTVVFHAIVLVLLFTLCFRTPLPLPGEAGVEVNLGMYAQGFGQEANQPEETEPVKETPKTEEQKAETNEVIEEDIVSEDEEAPSIEQPQEEQEEINEEAEEQTEEIIEEKQEEIVPEEEPVVNKKALFQVPNNDESTPTSEGDDQGEGEKGKDNGLKDIERYDANGGSGGGPSYDLGGRGAKSISTPSKDFSEEGTIVVNIKVDREGRVVETAIAKGTNIYDKDMQESALRAARNSIFNKDENAPEIQSGTITYTYIQRQ